MKLLHIFQVQEWLYTDGEDASATQFQKRLDELKAFGDPIFFRSAPNINGQTLKNSFFSTTLSSYAECKYLVQT